MNRIQFAKKLGLTVKVYPCDRTWSIYDGKTVHISSANPEIDIDHEMGHFFAATKRERTKPEWGLGRGPEYPDDNILEKFNLPNLVVRPNWEDRTKKQDELMDAREGAASLFGIAVTYVIGKKNEWRKHADLHTWDRASMACDLYCLISDSSNYHLKKPLTKVLAQIASLKGRS